VSEAKLPAEFQGPEGYPYSYWLAAEKEGYSSVGRLMHRIRILTSPLFGHFRTLSPLVRALYLSEKSI
jgi:hypothetical protein